MSFNQLIEYTDSDKESGAVIYPELEKPSFSVGRPTKYTSDLGSKILRLMSQGYSLTASAAQCGIHKQRIFEWRKKYPEFEEIVTLAQASRQTMLEHRLLTAKDGPTVTTSIFALKNAGPEDWRDRHEVVTKSSETIDLSQLSDEQLTQLQEALKFVNAKQIDHD